MTAIWHDYRLEDRYDRDSGRVFMTSIQALARIVAEQLRRDRVAGHHTAGFLSGYPGSPLGGFDMEVSRMLRRYPDLAIVHRPGVNEELAASAVMGSQLAAGRPDARYDGVLGLWYGKAPGLDRATDAIRHGVFAGTSPLGGVIALVGDDPAAKSSTMPSSSDAALVDLHMPILYPGNTAECLELGLHAAAISRASGLWSAMKIVTPVADGSGTVDFPVLDRQPIIPSHDPRPHPSAVFLGSARMIAAEEEFRVVRADLAYRYGVENRLNRIEVDPPDAWIGIVATGYTYYEMKEALHRLGLTDDAAIRDAGIRLLQLRMPVPFDHEMVHRFARGLSEIVVVEEKNPTLEWLIKDTLYDFGDRPTVVGKTHEDGRILMPSHGLLDTDAILGGLRERLARRIADRMTPVAAEASRTVIPLAINRTPFFCSGCPHNWGTKVPDGALVGAGTGCHGMSLLMPPERVGDTFGITAMGNEGAHWIGMEPFVETGHVYQNFGDGTYFHSGQLAIQAAIGAGVSITFKILYNSTVAMTGGQDASFSVGVPALCTILLAQGVKRVLITAPDPRGYDRHGLPAGVDVWDRTRIIEAQEMLAAIEGVTVLINDQECAAELRRDRKRGLVETPRTRIVINHRICEACGDCGDKSNCLSVQSIATPLGVKTAIDQGSCNFDYSCLEGDCPAFIEIEVADGPDRRLLPPPTSGEPPIVEVTGTFPVRLAGIGGTGVVTAAQILATAAMFDGWKVAGVDQTGLSQKAGPVVSDLILADRVATTNLVSEGEAMTLIAFDQLVAASDPVIGVCDPARTRVVVSTDEVPTGTMIGHPEIAFPADAARRRLSAAAASIREVEAAALAQATTGSVAAANIVVLGTAIQLGAIPVRPESVARAIELNGVAVDANLTAFGWGRAVISHPSLVEDTLARHRLATGATMTVPVLADALASRIDAWGLDEDLAARVKMLAADLVGFQSLRWATRFADTVERLAGVDSALRGWQLTRTAADSLHKLMAYKDEYEVARLMLLAEGTAAAAALGGTEVRWLLHPPVLAAFGRRRKVRFAAWTRPVFALLRASKVMRGTPFDPFGRSEVRKLERTMIEEFERALQAVAGAALDERYDDAVRIAGLPDSVRGYEALKLRRARAYRAELADALSGWR
ncbi:MAG TPA: indolepyruvate ferredoxin oxidoreductase family protein [Acidimicrobiia bacterium]|nr:indolepyruvate ferredoxin oxidoreductase family protein [Acidimicrobiia bacterium]